MADTLNLNEQALADEFAKQLAASMEAGEVVAADLDDAKKLFCDNWLTVKKILEYMKSLPGAGLVVSLVIAIGDGAYKILCS